jgi:hypothetical protein
LPQAKPDYEPPATEYRELYGVTFKQARSDNHVLLPLPLLLLLLLPLPLLLLLQL